MSDEAMRRRHLVMLSGHLSMRVASIGLQAFLVLAIGWVCDPADFGEFVIIVAHAVAGATLCAGGSVQGALRVAHLVAPGSAWEGSMIRLLVRSGLRRAALAAALVAVCLWFNPGVSPGGVGAGVVLTVAMTVSSVAGGLMIARGQAPVAQAADLFLRLPAQGAAVAALFAIDRVSGPALALVTAASAALHGGALLSRLRLRAHSTRRVPRAMRLRLGWFMNVASANAVLLTMLCSMDIVLGSLFVSPEAIAPLGIAGRVAGALAMLHGAIFDFHAASVARALRSPQPSEVRVLARAISIEATALSLATIIALAAASQLIPGNTPPSYRLAVAPLWVMLIARLYTGMLGPAPALLTIRGMHFRLASATCAGLLVEAILIVVLSPQQGTFGLAIGASAGICVYATVARASAVPILSRGAGTDQSAGFTNVVRPGSHSAEAWPAREPE